MVDFATTALSYAFRGWPVLPVHSPMPRGCSCGRPACSTPAKHPRTAHGATDATTDPTTVRTWWERWPNANIGIRTGEPAGLLVLDIDPDRGGLGSLLALEERFGLLPASAAVVTGGSGFHFYMRHDGRPAVGNTAGRLGPGLDTRGDGGLVVAPPSRHASGQTYRWCRQNPVFDPPPPWLLDLLTLPPPALTAEPTMPGGHLRGDRYWQAALVAELHRLGGIPEGQRNTELHLAAFRLGQLLTDDADEIVRDALHEAGAHMGLGPAEVRRTVTSGLTAGQRRPRVMT